MVDYAQSDPNWMESEEGSGHRPLPSAELERNPQTEFNFTIAAGKHAGNFAELRIRIEDQHIAAVEPVVSDAYVGLAKMRGIGDVVELNAERDVHALRDMKILEEREVQVREAGTD